MTTALQTSYRNVPDGLMASITLGRRSLSSFANQTNTGWTTSPFSDVTVADYDLFWYPQQVSFRAETAQAGMDAPTLADYEAEELDVTSAGRATNGSLNLNGVWQHLHAAAEAGDERSFIAAFKRIDWTLQPPDALMRAVRLAITADAPLVARELATEGAQRYPEHGELQKAARVLAPPRVIRSDLPSDPGLAANVTWLKANTESYGGRWVALKDGILLKDASSFEELAADLGDLRAQRILVTKVF